MAVVVPGSRLSPHLALDRITFLNFYASWSRYYIPLCTKSRECNPPACRRVLWILLCFGFSFSLSFERVSSDEIFDRLPLPPPPPLPSSLLFLLFVLFVLFVLRFILFILFFVLFLFLLSFSSFISSSSNFLHHALASPSMRKNM